MATFGTKNVHSAMHDAFLLDASYLQKLNIFILFRLCLWYNPQIKFLNSPNGPASYRQPAPKWVSDSRKFIFNTPSKAKSSVLVIANFRMKDHFSDTNKKAFDFSRSILGTFLRGENIWRFIKERKLMDGAEITGYIKYYGK